MAGHGGCASRRVSGHRGVSSPLSGAHAEGRRVEVGAGLREDPPLPGDETAAWAGLDPEAPDATAAPGDAAVTERGPHAH